uniref:CCHC-type domain-containing protein n=1 Tax=Oryza rufipogon TaxID=4529 RepID=A0A0E0R7G5_ORYRU
MKERDKLGHSPPGAHQVVSECGSSRFCIIVKSGGSKSSGGSHHGSDEEDVTMPVFDANLPAGVKDGLESACDYFDKCINQKFTKLERSIAMLVDRLPPPRQEHARQGRRPPPEHHEYDAEDESACILMEVIIIAVLDNLLAEVLLLWIGLLMIFTMTIAIVVLLVFRWTKGLPATPRDGTKPAASSMSKSQSKDESTAASGSKSRSVECYTCGGRGHYMRDCPNQKKVLMTKEGYVSESLSENSEGVQLDHTLTAGYRDIDDSSMDGGAEQKNGVISG